MHVEEHITIDSAISLEKALEPSVRLSNPPHPELLADVLKRQRIVEVVYWSPKDSDKLRLHQGQIVVDQDLTEDVKDAFALMREIKFPVYSVIPVKQFGFSDLWSLSYNNSSGFNYREIAKTNDLSSHALGEALDINPWENPYIREFDGYRSPAGAEYNPAAPGTMVSEHPVVLFFKGRGWKWGGDWTDRLDYMHFEKPRESYYAIRNIGKEFEKAA